MIKANKSMCAVVVSRNCHGGSHLAVCEDMDLAKDLFSGEEKRQAKFFSRGKEYIVREDPLTGNLWYSFPDGKSAVVTKENNEGFKACLVLLGYGEITQ